MSSHVENALKRATELIDVGQKAQALRDLSDMIERERRQYRRMWSKTLEDAVLLLVKLSCELRDNSYIKNTLTSYRHMAQTQAPGSLELVIKDLLDMSEERVAKALAQCGKSVQSIEDLDLDAAAPVAAVDASARAQRSEQTVLVPWLKFTWENLRNVLDILRNNLGLEQMYHATAHRAFKFCQDYQRKLEFRRLCDLLRSHIAMQARFAVQDQHELKYSFETMELHLQTRFEQLRVATVLRVWGEGFKTVEDIAQIQSLGVKKPTAQLQATYYQKLAAMFLASGSLLFHAMALKAYYDLNRERNKSLTKPQIEHMASSAVLAALCVPLTSAGAVAAAGGAQSSSSSVATASAASLDKEKNRRLAVLCGFVDAPDRDTLVRQLKTTGSSSAALADCHSEVRALFVALESQEDEGEEFDPQTLVQRLAPKIQWTRASSAYEAYAASLEQLVLVRAVGQLAQVFSTLQLDYVHQLVRDLGQLSGSPAPLTALQAELVLVRALRHRQLAPAAQGMRIDHGARLVRFTDASLAEGGKAKHCLQQLAQGLAFILNAKDEEEEEEKQVDVAEQILAEAAALEQRKLTIAQRKQEIYALRVFREKQRVERDEAARQERAEHERQWLVKQQQEEQRRREERAEKERVQQQIELDLKLNGIDAAQAKLQAGAGEFLSEQDKERLIREKHEKQHNQAVEAEKRVQLKTKKLDCLVRAAREAERPKLIKLDEERAVKEAKEEELAKEQRLVDAQQLVASKQQTRAELDAAFPRDVVQGFLSFVARAMQEQHDYVMEEKREMEYEQRMEAKLQRALTRKAEAAKNRKLELEESREQARLEEDARKREAKLAAQQKQ